MAAARIVLDTRDVDHRLAQLKRPGIPLARALNRAADSGKTLGARVVASDMRLKVGSVKDFVQVRHATPTSLQATISASAKRIPLLAFNARGPEPSRGRGGGVRANTTTARYPHAFITTVGRGGHRGVFQRKGTARLPIRELRGASIWQSFTTHRAAIETRVGEQLTKNVAREIAFALARGR